VISDRYIDSRIVYQQVTLDGIIPNPRAWLWAVHDGWTIKPDLTFLIVVPVSTALQRTSRRESGEHFEREAVLSRVQEHYMQLVEEDVPRFLILDGTQSPENLLRVAGETIRFRYNEMRKKRK